MTYNDVMKYCLGLSGVRRKSISPAGNAFAFCHGEKIFAYFETGAPIQWRFTLRVTPENYQRLIFPPKVMPAPDKGEGHWLTIRRVESFDKQQLLELIDWSYRQILITPHESSHSKYPQT